MVQGQNAIKVLPTSLPKTGGACFTLPQLSYYTDLVFFNNILAQHNFAFVFFPSSLSIYTDLLTLPFFHSEFLTPSAKGCAPLHFPASSKSTYVVCPLCSPQSSKAKKLYKSPLHCIWCSIWLPAVVPLTLLIVLNAISPSNATFPFIAISH